MTAGGSAPALAGAAIWLTAATSAVLAVVFVGLLAHARSLASFADMPNERSLHDRPVGRLGGLGLFAAVLITLGTSALLAPVGHGLAAHWTAAIVAIIVLIVTGAYDDRHDLSAAVRLGVHLACSVTFLFVLLFGSSLPLTIGGLDAGFGNDGIGRAGLSELVSRWPTGRTPVERTLLFTTIGIVIAVVMVWIANLYNFMDGADGLAGVTAVCGFGTYAWLAPAGSVIQSAAAAIAGAAAGFLVWNWSPARIFLGDAGSVPLGWAAAALGIGGIVSGAWPWWVPPIVFLPFVFDATVTLGWRMIRFTRFWEPHREHAYQRLVLSGWSHRRVALVYAALMLPGIVTACTSRYFSAGVLFAWVTVIICFNALAFRWVCRKSMPFP